MVVFKGGSLAYDRAKGELTLFEGEFTLFEGKFTLLLGELTLF